MLRPSDKIIIFAMVEKVKVLMLLICTVSEATAKVEESLVATIEEIKQGKIALPMTLKLNLNSKTKNAAVVLQHLKRVQLPRDLISNTLSIGTKRTLC